MILFAKSNTASLKYLTVRKRTDQYEKSNPYDKQCTMRYTFSIDM